VLKAQGAHNYSIFPDERNQMLFGYVEVENEARWAGHCPNSGMPEMMATHGGHHADQCRWQPSIMRT
jgi:L-rhamnose mutarotase